MDKRRLGNSKLEVSPIALGCMSLPDNLNEAQAIVDEALDAGITYFDTADFYGKGENEKIVGRTIARRRQDIILATKVGNQWDPNSDQVTWNPSKDYITAQVHESLRRLNTDYIDLYQLHGGMITDPADETIDAFESLKKEGLIREYGISSIRPNVISRYIENSGIASVMMQYSLLDRRPEELLDRIGAAGRSVVARGALAKGLLTKEGLDRAKKNGGYMDYSPQALDRVLNQLMEIEENLNALALHAVLEHETVASAVTGASSSAQIRDTVKAYDTAISSGQIRQAKEVTLLSKYTEHRE